MWLLLIAALAIGALACVQGCASAPAPAAAAGSSLARAGARVESAIPHTDDTGKQLLGEARKDIEDAAQGIDATADRLESAEQARAALEGKWYVRCGHRLEAIWRIGKWIIGLSAVAFIVGGILKGQSGLVSQLTGIIYQAGLSLATGGLYLLVRVLRWAFGKWVAKKAKAPARRLKP
jgi:hypothetical protein